MRKNEVRIDQIDLEEVNKFGYDFTNKEEDRPRLFVKMVTPSIGTSFG